MTIGGEPTAQQREVLGRIAAGLLYHESEAAFQAPRRRTDLIFEYNQTPPGAAARRRELLEAIFARVGERVIVNGPLSAAFGSNTYIGDDFYGNSSLALVDDVEIRIGDGVLIAPNVTLTTTGHPVHPALREDFGRFSEPIIIEDEVWIGSNAAVMPGVHIGHGSVIGAGSVVTRDVPAMVVVQGVPARVARPITAADLDGRKSHMRRPGGDR